MRIVLWGAAVILAIALLGAFLAHLAPYVRGFSFAVAPTPYQGYVGEQRAAVSYAAAPSNDVTITEEDYGKTFIYASGTRFNILLSGRDNNNGYFSCSREGVITVLSTAPRSPQYSYSAHFEAGRPGDCVFSSGAFIVSIHVN